MYITSEIGFGTLQKQNSYDNTTKAPTAGYYKAEYEGKLKENN